MCGDYMCKLLSVKSKLLTKLLVVPPADLNASNIVMHRITKVGKIVVPYGNISFLFSKLRLETKKCEAMTQLTFR